MFAIGLMIGSLALMFSPKAVKMTFADGPNQAITRYYSYISSIPLGYGIGFLMIIVVISSVISILLIISMKNREIERLIPILLFICIFSFILSWVIFSTYTIVWNFVFFIHLSGLIRLSEKK